jgi:uncharacterized protein
VVDVDKARRTPPPGFDPEYITAPPLIDGPWMVQSLVLDVSGTCNMACRYCAESITMPKRVPMSPEILDAAWKFLFPKGVKAISQKTFKNQIFSFHVGTGEPFLNFPLMQELGKMVDQARSEGVENLHVFLTTNGSLLNEEIMEWLIASRWNIKISFDGPAAIHDRWRIFPGGEGTYDRTAQALAYLAGRVPDRVAACAVICRGGDPAGVFDAVESLGVRIVDMAPVAHRDESIIPGPDDIETYRKFIMDYAARFLQEDIDDKNPPAMLTNLNQCVMRLMGYKLGRVVCGAGRHYQALGPGGDIYPCGRLIGVEKYRVGHIETGLDEEATAAFCNDAGRTYERREACSHCWAAPLCCGPCYACSEMFGPGGGEPIDYQCAYMLATAEAAHFVVSQLRENNPERLLMFMPQQGLQLLNFD